MSTSQEIIDKAIQDSERLRATLKRRKSPQVRSAAEKSIVKATSLAWFNNYRVEVVKTIDSELLNPVDAIYKFLLDSSEKAASRNLFDGSLKKLKIALVGIRGYTLAPPSTPKQTTDQPPDFSKLVVDTKMRDVIENRWVECTRCISANAPLSATVMMGGLLEALLLGRINKETNKAPIFTAKSVPKDPAGKGLPMKEWTLRNYIDIAHELGWISQSAKDVGEVLRDYRNYVHPYKELSHGVTIRGADAVLFWEICKNITRQLL